MNQFFKEYGGMIIAIAGTLAFLAVFGQSMMSQEGDFAQMLSYWGNGGC